MSVPVVHNVVHLKDVPVRKTGSAEIKWVSNKQYGAAELTMGRTIMPPGCSNPLHYHPNCEEILHILSGDVDHYVEGMAGPMRINSGDTVVIPRGLKHKATNVGKKPAEWIVCFSSADRETVICENNSHENIHVAKL